jgi:CheY-like chemotaxis protein
MSAPNAKKDQKKQKTLMLVDDKEVSNFIMKKNIAIYLPLTKAVEFTDPELALNSLDEVKPDVIFLDLGLPMIEDGWNFLDRLNAMSTDYKVVILTSSISNEDYEKAMSYKNVIHFISKPIFGEELQVVFDELDNQPNKGNMHTV